MPRYRPRNLLLVSALVALPLPTAAQDRPPFGPGAEWAPLVRSERMDIHFRQLDVSRSGRSLVDATLYVRALDGPSAIIDVTVDCRLPAFGYRSYRPIRADGRPEPGTGGRVDPPMIAVTRGSPEWRWIHRLCSQPLPPHIPGLRPSP